MDAFLFSKKGGFEVPTNHHPIPTVPIGVSRGLLCRAMPTQLPAAPGGSWTPLGWWPVGSTGWDLYQRHLRGKVVDNEKNLSKLHGFFDIDVLGITWHWMKWHEITTWLGDFSGKAATSGSANILNTSRFAYRSVLNMTFFLSAPTKPVFNVCAQNASPQDDTFFWQF